MRRLSLTPPLRKEKTLTPKSSKHFARAAALALILLAGAVGGLLGSSAPTADAACDRRNFDCAESGPIVDSRCYNYDCLSKCIECSTGCGSSGCCYYEWMECPVKPYGQNIVPAVICGGACLRSFDWE